MEKDLFEPVSFKNLTLKNVLYVLLLTKMTNLIRTLTPYYNRRTDGYGGCLSNRSRIICEVVKAVREAVGPHFPVMIKLNFDDFMEEGEGLSIFCLLRKGTSYALTNDAKHTFVFEVGCISENNS